MRRAGILLVFAVPAAVLLAGRIAASRATVPVGDAARADLEAKSADAAARFREIVTTAEDAARRTLALGPDAVAGHLTPDLRRRFEGAGTVRAERYETWDGTPLEASLAPGGPGASWRIVSRGVRTSLVARSETDADGRYAIASFALDVASESQASSSALPELCRGATMRWSFPATGGEARESFAPGPPARLSVPLLDPRGGVAAVVTLEHVGAAHVAARRRARADAIAGVLFTVLIAAALLRRTGPIDGSRLLVLTAGIVAARLALSASRALEELLPRSLGSPSLFGRAEGWGLLASPGALLATALAGFLLARAFARFTSRVGALLPTAVAALLAVALLGGSLARDARIPTPRFDLTSPGALALVIALGLAVAGAAELAAALARPRSRTACTLAVIVPVAAIALVPLHRETESVADERLRTAYAPLVLEQSARRKQALSSAVAEAASSPRLVASPDPAFALWIATDLFQQGFASSLDLFDAQGLRVSHFGFGLPKLTGPREATAHAPDASGRPAVVEESVSFGASIERVLHADAAAVRPGGGRIVGHVLEDGANLPFLPGNAPYLRALGRGGGAVTDGLTDEPDYVVYSGDGRVLLTTLHQPPAATPALREQGRRQAATELDAGGTRYRALPLADGDRLHLLLAPARGLLDVLGDGVRLLLVAGALVLAAGGLAALAVPGGPSRVLDLVRASFYRKLLAAVVAASLVPLVGIALVLRGAIERHGASELADSAAAVVAAAERVVADYQSTGEEDPEAAPLRVTDEVLVWLRRVVGQEIHLYEGGVLAATSKPEMFDSALRLPRLPGEIETRVVREGRPFVVRHETVGAVTLPVAYARADLKGGPSDAVLAIPLVLEQRTFARSVERLIELLLLGTTALAGLLAASAALLARQVAGPVRRLADASRRIAQGDYTQHLASSARDEMGSLVADFNSMARALAQQRADLTRRNQLEAWAEMARSIAHEIKNPLTPIQLSAEHVRRLLADRGVLPSAEIEACLDAIVRQVSDLRDISQAFSTYARIPDLALEPMDPATFLRDVTAPYLSSPPPGIVVREEHDGAPPVRIDRRILARAVVNLIANAIEAMPRGGTLTVASGPDPERAGALLSVRDTGTGLSDEARARLFEPYFSTKSSGTGLGLAIVRRVVEAHGGTIDVASASGRGTTFTIHLPELILPA
jgi:signal transduction histidine kinase